MTPLSGLDGALLHLEAPATPMLLQLANPVRRLFVLDGLHSGQRAYYIKVHHAVLDGQAGMLLAQALFDLNKKPRAMPRRVAEPAELPGLAELAAAARQHDAAQYIKQLRRLPEVVKNKQLPVILVCASGGRAVRAQGIARKLGYEKAQAMAGGLKSWKEANLPVEKA